MGKVDAEFQTISLLKNVILQNYGVVEMGSVLEAAGLRKCGIKGIWA